MAAATEVPPRRQLWRRWAVVLAPGLLLYFVPVPGLGPAQRHLLAVFLATIVSLVAQPLPMGASVLIAMTLLALTGTVPPDRVLSGFANTTVWLIFAAFLFSRAVVSTGLGMRIAFLFVRRFGGNALSLGYAVAAADLVLAPFVPSDTARGGGIICPIVRSLAQAFSSVPGATARRAGAFLVLVGFHTTYTASAMFLTGMAANPLIAEFAQRIAHVELTWIRWVSASIVPGLLSLALVPWAIFRLAPPEIADTGAARELARTELSAMGPMSRNQLWLAAILLGVMAGWVTSPWHHVPNAFVALAGVSAFLLAGVLEWRELLAESNAWDALIWFAPLVMMAEALERTGVIAVLSSSVVAGIRTWPWIAALAALTAVYVYVHYAFASMTAHITALYPGFLGAALLAGAPPMLAALALAFFSNLNAGLTHYGTGSAPVYFGTGYVDQKTWWRIGFVLSVMNLVIWLGPGALWWKALGLW